MQEQGQMADLVLHAPAKINLHLEVLGLRSDGFHELAMIMQSIDLVDQLAFTPTADGQIQLICDRAELATDSSNLIVRAAELLRSRVGLPELGAQIKLDKRIPIGAGLAGGSSDGAAALFGLNQLWGLGLTTSALADLAAELGSDMPFCLAGGCQLCFGRGERLEPLAAASDDGLGLLLIKHPLVSVSTPWAYGRCRDLKGHAYLKDEPAFAVRRQELRRSQLVQALLGQAPWPALRNDLQAVVEPDVPVVATGLSLLRQASQPVAVAMSGSGPSLFALFSSRELAAEAATALAGSLQRAGFDSWVCSTRPVGVSVES
jgi:4-diphosphocytidyl-2-C-methyl-D-erythritol kinase